MSKIGVNTGKIFEQLFDTVLPAQGDRILTKDEYAPFLVPTISGRNSREHPNREKSGFLSDSAIDIKAGIIHKLSNI